MEKYLTTKVMQKTYIKELKEMKVIGFLGKYTLELYVLHGIYSDILRVCMRITFNNNKLLFTVLYFALPIITVCTLDKAKLSKTKDN